MKTRTIIALLAFIACLSACTPKVAFNEALRNNLDLKSIKPEPFENYSTQELCFSLLFDNDGLIDLFFSV